MKVAVFFGAGYEEIEALAVVDILRRGNVEVTMVGVKEKTVVGAHEISVNMDTTVEEINYEAFDMIVLPGGVPGVNHLMACESLMEALKQFKAQNKWIAAICAAPSILGQLGLLKGEEAICYPGYEEKLIGCKVSTKQVVVSGKIVTAKGAGVALDFGYKLLEIIQGEGLSNKIRTGMIAN